MGRGRNGVSGVVSITSGADNYQYCRFNALPINDCSLRCPLKIGVNVQILYCTLISEYVFIDYVKKTFKEDACVNASHTLFV